MGKILSVDSEAVDTSFWKILLNRLCLGLFIGLIYYLITICIESIWHLGKTSSDIASVMSASISLLALILIRSAQPLVMSVVPATLLWGLSSQFVGHNWLFGLGWSIVLYILAYGIMAWLTYQLKLVYNLIISAVIVIIFRVVLNG